MIRSQVVEVGPLEAGRDVEGSRLKRDGSGSGRQRRLDDERGPSAHHHRRR